MFESTLFCTQYCISDYRIYAFINIHEMKSMRSAFSVLIVKMYASVLNGCLIDVLNWLLLDSFIQCLTSSNDSYLGLKRLINCLCALTMTFCLL